MTTFYMRFALLLMVLVAKCNTVYAGNSLQQQLTTADARHLLSRTGFGASPYELMRFSTLTRQQAVSEVVDGLVASTQQPPPKWTRTGAPHHFARRDMPRRLRREFNEAREQEMHSLRHWWIREMIETPYPQTERLVLFWHNHFTTAFTAVGDQSISMARQHTTIRRHASGNFRHFLKAMIRDPALLNYLDNNNSEKSAPNENLARELLELFTLGEGHYQETDVKNLARALTGYSYNNLRDLQFTFRRNQHDIGFKAVFGQQGKFDGDSVIDLILEQPQSARFIAQKLWHWMVSPTPPAQSTLDSLAHTFRHSDYNIKALYRATLLSDEFWAPENRNQLVRSPVSLTIGTIRSTGIVPGNWQTIAAELQQLGQQLFEPPNVAGWPGGRSWITPARLLNRLEWLRNFQSGETEQAANMMATDSMSNPMGSPQNAMNSTDPHQLTINMAAEEFDGPVQYQVSVFADDTILWSSGNLSLQGGRDTKRYGRVQGINNLPWQSVQFQLPGTASRFDSIEIQFLNNKQQKGNDRNLYIRSASFGDRRYLAENGIQTNQCPKVKRSKGGALLCNGRLKLLKPESNRTAATPASNTLRASGVYLRTVTNPTHNRPTISFVLTDAQTTHSQWQTILLTLQRVQKNGSYQLSLSDSDCWPRCFVSMPECQKGKSPARRWVLKLNTSYRTQCSYRKLESQDQQFVDKLISLLPDLYSATVDSKKLKNTNHRKHFNDWEPHIESAARQVHTNVSAILIIAPNKQTTTHLSVKSPVKVAGRTPAQFNADFQQLAAGTGISSLAGLLIGESPADNSNNLTSVLTNLIYQLH